jgi:hypothetical protein
MSLASDLPWDERVLVVIQGLGYINAAETVATDDEAVGFVEKVVFG